MIGYSPDEALKAHFNFHKEMNKMPQITAEQLVEYLAGILDPDGQWDVEREREAVEFVRLKTELK